MGPVVTLTSDFGTRDPYCGAMRGVLLSQAPGVQLVDLSNDVPPQDILAGAWVLRHAACEFPPGTVHLAVVDPGVGSKRRALAVRAAGFFWVGPDNGLMSFALDSPDAVVHQITARANLRRVSATFHGRDIFAPAAAHLAAGLPLEQLGPPVHDAVRLSATRVTASAHGIDGSIVHVDHFGNLISSIDMQHLAPLGDPTRLRVSAGATLVQGVVQTFADVAPGRPAALVGSAGLLELVVRNGSAADEFGLQRGDPVTVASGSVHEP